MLRPWKTLARRTLCSPNRFLTVELHTVELPDGRRIDDWPWLVTPDYANVLARTVDGRFLCFRQTKYAAEGLSLAPIGGFLEPDEPALQAAQRELLEETGYAGDTWIPLGSTAVDANRGNGRAHLFLALNCREVAAAGEKDLADQTLLLLTHEELSEALEQGEFKILAWAAIIALGLRHIERHGL